MGGSVPAPDGGFWAWLAVFGCFMGNVIGDGVMYRYSGIFIGTVMYVHVQQDMHSRICI